MKEIPNKIFSPSTDTVKLLRTAIDFVPQAGFTITDIRSRLRVAEAISKVDIGGTIQLEDADHVTAVEAIKLVRWTTINKDIVQFYEQFGL